MTYRIDSAGHKVPYGEVMFTVSKTRGSRETWRMSLCHRCWLEMERKEGNSAER